MSIPLNPNDMNLKNTGVDEFFYPISHSEILDVRDTMLRNFFHLGSEADLLRLVDKSFIVEMMYLYRAVALVNRMDQNGYQPCSPDSRVIPAIINGSKPPFPNIVDSLAEGVQEPMIDFGRIGREIQWNGFDRTIRRPMSESEIIAHPGSGLVSYHACSESHPVACTRHYDWFDTVEEPIPSGISMETIQECIDIVQDSFNQGNEKIPEYLCEYAENFLIKLLNLTFTHFWRLVEHAQLPNELWTGSGGNIWTRILSFAVSKSGGEIIAHDHSNSSSFANDKNILVKQIVDLTSCNEFMVNTALQAKNLRRYNQSGPLSAKFPRISSSPELDEKPFVRPARSIKRLISRRRTKCPSEISEIMYVSKKLHDDSPDLSPGFSNITQIDWQTRLLYNFDIRTNYSIVYKPHPEGIRPPDELSEISAVNMMNGRFEHMTELPDAFLFDSPYSTTFTIALLREKPVILIDFGFFDWNRMIRKLLDKRCVVIDGWIDDENKARVNWSELFDGIKRATELTEFSFVDKYLLETTGI